jgi:uncharacterized protein YjgD (DUF1641 family)
MAQPILLHVAPRDPQHELNVQLQEAPAKHAEAILAAYEVLPEMHDRGVLDLMRGTLGGGEKILEQAVAVASGPDAIRASRNVLLLVKALGEIEPALLSDLTRAIPKALVQPTPKKRSRPDLSN